MDLRKRKKVMLISQGMIYSGNLFFVDDKKILTVRNKTENRWLFMSPVKFYCQNADIITAVL